MSRHNKLMNLQRIRRSKNDSFTTIDNTILRDKNISLKAKGLLLVVMGLPDNWEFSVAGITSVLKEGRDGVYACIKELKEYGYVAVEQTRTVNGKLDETVYTFRERPLTAKPYTAKPYTAKPTQYKKQSIKETKNQVNISLTIAEAFPNNHPYPMKELIDAFPEITFGPGQCGAVEKEVKDTPTDREAWNLTIDKYKIEFNPELNRYWPNKITNVLSVFKDFRSQLERQQNAQPIANQKRNNVRDTESTLRYLNASAKI